jgi:hypothetical protein
MCAFLAAALEAAGVRARALAGNTKSLEAALRAFDDVGAALTALVVPYD